MAYWEEARDPIWEFGRLDRFPVGFGRVDSLTGDIVIDLDLPIEHCWMSVIAQKAHLEASKANTCLERRSILGCIYHPLDFLRRCALIVKHSSKLNIHDIRLHELVR